MARPKNQKNSADIEAEIRRLEEKKSRATIVEDQRRGAIIRDCLSRPSGAELCNILRPLVTSRDAFLFGLEPTPSRDVSSDARSPKPIPKANIAPTRGAVSGQ